uniref:S-protein homolog n=1 Tax=Solanum tuberosum TaxID=4113 RepID=M1A4V6_SOLTU
MAYNPCSKILLPLFILSIINHMQIINAFTLHSNYTLRFVSGLPQNTDLLKVHCQSRDDDIGDRILKPGDHFDFSFHMNLAETTLYHCGFFWGPKHNNFDVFKRWHGYCGSIKLFQNGYCTWLMKDSGIYFALGPNPSPGDFKFLHSWL